VIRFRHNSRSIFTISVMLPPRPPFGLFGFFVAEQIVFWCLVLFLPPRWSLWVFRIAFPSMRQRDGNSQKR
jgi:hypothetical protein